MEATLPRYRIERNFPDGPSIPINDEGRKAVAGVVANNAEHGVTWVHSYVTPERKNTSCIDDAPTPQGHPQGRRPRRPAGGPNHRSERARPLLLPALNTPQSHHE